MEHGKVPGGEGGKPDGVKSPEEFGKEVEDFLKGIDSGKKDTSKEGEPKSEPPKEGEGSPEEIERDEYGLPRKKTQTIGKEINTIILNESREEDKHNVLTEAIEMKVNQDLAEKREKGGLGGVLARFKYNVPIIGAILKAKDMNAYKEEAQAGIDEHGLEGAFSALGLDSSKSKVFKTEDLRERAQQIVDNGVEEGGVYRSLLDEKDTVEKIDLDKETQKATKEALNEYYDGLKEGKTAEELEKIFDEKIAGLSEKDNFDLIQKAARQKRDEAAKLFASKEYTDKQLKKYINHNITLYKTDLKEGIYTKKEVDEIAKAVVIGSGLASGAATGALLKVVLKREVSSGVRKAVKFAGGTGGIAGFVAGGVMGAIRGAEKAGAKRSEYEINKINDPTAVVEAIRKKYDKDEYGLKGWAKGEKILDELELKRDRVNASELIEKLGGDLSEEKLMDLYANILARGKFSNEKQIDLIKYGDGDKAKLEEALNEAYKKLNFEEDPDGKKKEAYGKFFNEHFEKLGENYKEAKELEKKFKHRMMLVNGIEGALAGYAAGALFQKLSESSLGEAAKAKAAGLLGLSATGEDLDSEVDPRFKEFEGKPIQIEDAGDGKVSIFADQDGNTATTGDRLYIRGGGENPSIDLRNEEQFEALRSELKQNFGYDIEKEPYESSYYSEETVGSYLENAKNAVDNSGGVDWSRSATRVAFGTPTATVGDGMDTYEVPVWGINGEPVPDGAKFYLDLDGDGSGQALEYTIENGKAIVPADVLDTSRVGNGGAASFIGTARVGEMDGNTMISYATAFGEDADASTTISTLKGGEGVAFTITDTNGEGLSQFAVDANGDPKGNLSEIFNGIPTDNSDHLPAMFKIKDTDGNTGSIMLASGENTSGELKDKLSIPDLDYRGGYHEEFDSYKNEPFMGSASFLGTPLEWDKNGDGQMSSLEEANFFRQLLVRTGTDPFMLAQNASNYGLLEPARLGSIFTPDELAKLGIKDGAINNMTDLNTMIENLKLRENADLYDKLVNATIDEMQDQAKGGSFTVETITDRASTYVNSSHEIDAWRGSNSRTIVYARNSKGELIGNQGVVCRALGIEGQKVGTMTDCGGQTAGERLGTPGRPGTPTYTTTTTTTTTTTPTDDNPNPVPGPEPEPEPTPEPEPGLDPKNLDAERKNNDSFIDRRVINEDETPRTTIDEDRQGFEAVEKQQSNPSTPQPAEEAAGRAAQQQANDAANAAEEVAKSVSDNNETRDANDFAEGQFNLNN